MKLDVYGTLVEATRERGGWAVYYLGNEGKRRRASDISIPREVCEDGVRQYLADLCHERARPGRDRVVIIA